LPGIGAGTVESLPQALPTILAAGDLRTLGKLSAGRRRGPSA